MDIKDRLKQRRLLLDMTLEDVARIVGVTRATIQKYESGVISSIPSDKIELLAKALQTTPAYIMGWEDVRSLPSNVLPIPTSKKLPLVGDIACGTPILAAENIDDYIDVPDWVHADFALRCRGDSMINARIFDGDVVFIRRKKSVELGQIAAVRIGEEATLKRVYYHPDEGKITLRACNPMYQDKVYEGDALNEIEILGLAVEFNSKVRHN